MTDIAAAMIMLKEYLDRARYAKRFIRGVHGYLKPFMRFLANEKIHDLREVKGSYVDRYFADVRTGVSARTGKSYGRGGLLSLYNAVRLLFLALYRAGAILKNPMAEATFRVREKQKPRRVFSEDEINKFLDAIDLDATLGLRDRTMFELAYSSGLRVSEIAKLDRGDIDLEQRMVLIREAKWMKDRVVPLNEVAHAFLARYLAGKNRAEAPAFSGKAGRLGTGGIERRFRFHCAKAGLSGRGLSIHSIRHATATHLLAHGADLRYVQELLGHESIETTVTYTNELVDNLKRIYRSFHPRENLLHREIDAEYLSRVERLVGRLIDPARTWGARSRARRKERRLREREKGV
jgi:site-specific recombinase XerD